jgi:hypothetical protein
VAALLMVSVGFLFWDLKDIRLKVSQEQIRKPFYAEEYRIFFKLGEIQGLIHKELILQAQSSLSKMLPDISAYRGRYPDYLHFETALLWLALGEPETALTYLKKSVVESKDKHLKDFLRHPAFHPLRNHPRYQEISGL